MSETKHRGPAQRPDGSQTRNGGPAQEQDGTHGQNGGPAQQHNENHADNGGPPQTSNDSQDDHGGPVQVADDNQKLHGGPAQTQNGSQHQRGGPAHPGRDNQEDHGGPAQTGDESHVEHGGPTQEQDGNHGRNGGPAQGKYDSQAEHGGPAQSHNDNQARHGGPAVWNPTLLSDLRAAGEDLADLIEVRKAAENRARTLGHLDTAQICPPWIATAEKAAREALQDAYKRAVPREIREWAATVPGLGSGELFPRMIAIIGDPCVATPLLPIAKGDTGRGARSQPSGPPYIRSPHQLWQWTGMGDAWSKAREDYLGRKPEQADLLHAGKRSQIPPLLYVWSTSLVKGQRFESVTESDYWKLLNDRLALTRGHDGPCDTGTGPQPCFETHRKHERQCQNHKRPPARSDGCGIALHPEWGEPGSPWRPGHIQMDAHRLMQKRLLMDLWKVAWQLHDGRNPATADRKARRQRAAQ